MGADDETTLSSFTYSENSFSLTSSGVSETKPEMDAGVAEEFAKLDALLGRLRQTRASLSSDPG